jgi:NADPH2:quinone reductase
VNFLQHVEALVMRAVVYDRRGPAREVLRLLDRPLPEPGPGEVRIKVAVSALNPSDIKARSGWNASAPMQFPLATPHRDGAGIIDAVGPGVAASRIGERVWFNQILKRHPFGSAADYTITATELAWRLPAAASFAEGACLPIPAVTAHAALMRDGALAGRTVLVQGGAGAVGFYAVQLAKWAGAGTVIATVSRDEQATLARQAGADAVINYRAPDAREAIDRAAGGPNGVHHIVEVNLAANAALDAAVLADNGVIAAFASDSDQEPRLPFRGLNPKDAIIRFVGLSAMPEPARARAASDIIALLEARRLRHHIAARFPLERIVEAHELQETGRVVGKVLIDVADLE